MTKKLIPWNKTHGKWNTRVYHIWQHIKTRCHKDYPRYGQRGIKCEWKSFEEFYADMGEPLSNKHSIDRIDNDGNYSKENCRWATAKQQMNNNSRNILLNWNSETKTLMQWSEQTNLAWHTLWHRLKNGWSIEKTLSTPSSRDHKKKRT